MKEVKKTICFVLMPWERGFYFMDYRMIISIAFVALVFIWLFAKNTGKKHVISTKFITRSAVFAAISIILYLVPYFNFALPIFPSFLKIHIDEVPAFIAGFAYGPLSAVFVIVVKTLAKLPMTSTGGVGELADLIYSTAFVVPAAIYYKKHKTIKGALIGLGISTICQLVVACFVTTFLILDFYIMVMGWPEIVILKMCQAINPAITSLRWPFLFMVALPFNALKDVIVIAVTLLLYKRLHSLIDRLGAQTN